MGLFTKNPTKSITLKPTSSPFLGKKIRKEKKN
jgi:hypothetical protein